jgi:tetratricopeptide (TPR) repeat protein
VLEGKFRADGLVNGHYHLRLVMKGPGGRVESPPLPIVVLEPEGDSAPPPAWSEVTEERLAAQESQVQNAMGARPDDGRKKKKKKIPVRPIQEGYEKALEHLARGNPARARAELFRNALAILKQHGSEGLDILSQVEILNANQVAEKAPEALLPLALVHHDLYRYARQREVSLISTHARTTTLGMAELYLDSSRSASAGELSADIFASIGSALLEASLHRFSERLFRRALELDGDHPLALLSLGMSSESLGDYERAVDFFEDLVKAHPEHYQGRLRLAINLGRLFRPKAASRQYREILDGKTEPWIKSLAYQGLAQIYLDDDELEEAAKLLQRGIEELPGEDKLAIQLAFIYDAMLQGERSKEVLAAIEPSSGVGGSEGESSRHRYTRGPEEAVSSLRIDLWRQAKARLAELQEALASSGVTPRSAS